MRPNPNGVATVFWLSLCGNLMIFATTNATPFGLNGNPALSQVAEAATLGFET